MRYTALDVCKSLMACPSVTPIDAGALGVVQNYLKPLGFTCQLLEFTDQVNTAPVTNLFARLGTGSPHLCFAGHTDVVPPGDLNLWTSPPFTPTIIDSKLYGRGAVDMKGAIGCFISAVSNYEHLSTFKGSLSFLITGDEEGPSINGTCKVLEWLSVKGEIPDAVIIGEPTSKENIGDTVKVGRRGSLNATITIRGKQGHVAYPHLAKNPIPILMNYLKEINEHPLDTGTDLFQPSNLEITSILVDNTATNVIPAAAKARFNIRFNNLHTQNSLSLWLETTVKKYCPTEEEYTLEIQCNAEPFYTQPGILKDIVYRAITEIIGKSPESSTSGGTSDGRFIWKYAPVIECGLCHKMAHQVNEYVPISHLDQLTAIYGRILSLYYS